MLLVALVCDSLYSNLQEKILHNFDISINQMAYLMFGFTSFSMFFVSLATHQLFDAISHATAHPSYLLVLVAICSCKYLGVQCIFRIISEFSVFQSELVTSSRKAASVLLSMALFPKTISMYFWVSSLLVCLGVLLGLWELRGRKPRHS